MCMIEDLRNNDEHALEEMFKIYYSALYAYIFDKTKSDDISKDVIQITFIKTWKNRQSLKKDLDISVQLFRIARTTMIDELRRIQVRKKLHTQLERHEVTEDINEHVYYNETLQRLETIIKKMPPMRQQVFRLSKINNYTYKEIAQILRISPKTVENHINLALKFIRPFFSILIFIEALT